MMQPTGYFVDSNLLVLLIVGSVGRDLIAKHRRLRRYDRESYDTLLENFISKITRLFVTPNILTETSNLLGYDSQKQKFLERLQLVIKSKSIQEITLASEDIACRNEFKRFGLTDTVLLSVIKPETPLITDDFDLYREALKIHPDAVINFTHYRDNLQQVVQTDKKHKF